MQDLTSAYTVFANGGVRRQDYIIERIDDANGETIYRAAHITQPAIDPGVAWLTTTALQKVSGTRHGRGCKGARVFRSLPRVKQARRMTTWTHGSSATRRSLTCGVWVGLDTPKTIMAQRLRSSAGPARLGRT